MCTRVHLKFNPTNMWNIQCWTLEARAKNRTSLMGPTFFPYIPSSFGTAARWMGKLWHPPTETPPQHTQTHNRAAHWLWLRLCFRNRPAGSANQRAHCPHLLGTATICLTLWLEAVRSDPGLGPPSTAMLLWPSVNRHDIIKLRVPRRC